MGRYLNPDNSLYQEQLNSAITIDKTLLIKKMIDRLNTTGKYVCMSRPRRFGKSTDANMLAAYFSKGCNSSEMFGRLKISASADYELHLNKHNVIQMNIQQFFSQSKSIVKMIDLIYRSLAQEVRREYQIESPMGNITDLLYDLYSHTGKGVIFVIDEWDCVFRELKADGEQQREYLDYLRLILKDQPYVALVYMTGILPIKKYGTHSALNMFDEISMIDPKDYSEYMGFTEKEVEVLCADNNVEFACMKEWYDGYRLRDNVSVYSPRSVVASICNGDFSNYWVQTETYEALKMYIDLNFDGLKDAVVRLLVGDMVQINTMSFQNDMSSFVTKDDILTLLVHLGYLGYDNGEAKVYIPNQEVRASFVTSIQNSNWSRVTNILQDANELLESTWHMQDKRVASLIEKSHYETSILQYNDENALSYTISLAYITAKQYYNVYRELPCGKGFADLVFVPRAGINKPAMIIELKWNEDADAGIKQIKDRRYYLGLEEYLDNLLLVGISYNKDTKEHTCRIERYGDKRCQYETMCSDRNKS